MTDLVWRRKRNFQANFLGSPGEAASPTVDREFRCPSPSLYSSIYLPLLRSDTDLEFSRRPNASVGDIGRARCRVSLRGYAVCIKLLPSTTAVPPLPSCPKVSQRPRAVVIYATQSNIVADPRVYSAGFATITTTAA